MSFLIGRYEFEGPLINWRGIKNEGGIYAVMSFANHEYELVDMAQSDDLQSEFINESKLKYWQEKSKGMLTYSVHYHPRASRGRREEIVNEILREFDGQCRHPACSNV